MKALRDCQSCLADDDIGTRLEKSSSRLLCSSPCSPSLASADAPPRGRNLRLRLPIQRSAPRSNDRRAAQDQQRRDHEVGEGPARTRRPRPSALVPRPSLGRAVHGVGGWRPFVRRSKTNFRTATRKTPSRRARREEKARSPLGPPEMAPDCPDIDDTHGSGLFCGSIDLPYPGVGLEA